MSKIPFFKSLPLTFYSKPFYREIARTQGSAGLGYVMLVALILALMTVASLWYVSRTFDLEAVVKNITDEAIAENEQTITPFLNRSFYLLSHWPRMRMEEGKLRTKENIPLLLATSPDDAPVVMVDTSGQFTELKTVQQDYPSVRALFTRHSIAYMDQDADKIHLQAIHDFTGHEENVNAALHLLSQIPLVSWEGDLASSDATMPQLIEDGKGNVLLAIDTRENTPQFSSDISPILIMTQDRFIFNIDPSHPKAIAYRDIDRYLLDSILLVFFEQTISIMRVMLFIIGIPLLFFIFAICVMILALITALLALIIANVLGVKSFYFETGMRITGAALIPATLVYLLAGFLIPHAFLLASLTGMIYVIFGIKALKEESS